MTPAADLPDVKVLAIILEIIETYVDHFGRYPTPAQLRTLLREAS